MLDTLIMFLIAGGIGALVGTDRELAKSSNKKKQALIVFGGIRSYTFLSLLGAMSFYLGDMMGNAHLFVLLMGLGITMFILTSYIYSSKNNDQHGLTSELSAIMIYLLGVMVMAGDEQIAIILAILLAIIMTSREKVSNLFTTMSTQELTTTLKFAVIAFIILPLLPDESYSLSQMLGMSSEGKIMEMQFFNPYEIWFFVVLMSGISYIGYILSRFIGAEKGIGVSGAIGGLVSSTAVTSSMSDQSKKYPNIVYPFVFATLVANLIMFLRVIFIVTVFNPSLLKVVFIPVGIMLLVLMVLIYFSIKKSHDQKMSHKKTDNLEFKSPFQIGPALKFAAFIVGIKFLSGVALIYQDIWGPYALYAVSFFSGFADVDAVTQEMSSQGIINPETGEASIVPHIATTAIIIAVITNTVVKMSIAKIFGAKEFGTRVSQALGIISIVGLLSLFLVF